MPPIMPDRVFHGTTFDFTGFDGRFLGNSVRNPTTEFGFYFSESREDAASWALRALTRGTGGGSPRMIVAHLEIGRPIEVSEAKFRFYLQTARTSTIQRDLRKWQAKGHDGLTTLRGGHRWWVAFDPTRIRILASEPLQDWHVRASREQGEPAPPDPPAPTP